MPSNHSNIIGLPCKISKSCHHVIFFFKSHFTVFQWGYFHPHVHFQQVFGRYLWNGPSALKLKKKLNAFFFDFGTRNWNIKLVLTTLGKALGTIRISFIVADCGLGKKCAKMARHMILNHYYRSVQNIPSRIAEGPRDATTQWQRRSFKLRDRMVNFLKKVLSSNSYFIKPKKRLFIFGLYFASVKISKKQEWF